MSPSLANVAFIAFCTAAGVFAGLAAEKAARRRLPELHTGYQRHHGVRVAAITGILFGAIAWRFGVSWTLPAFLFLSVAGVVLSRIDLQHKLLPNAIVFPTFLGALVLLFVDATLQFRWGNLVLAAAGAAVMFVVYLLLAIISPRGLGMGDVKFSAVLGLYLGYLSMGSMVLGLLLGFLVGAVVGGALLIAGLAGRRSSVPFGPSMFSGAVLAVLFGHRIGSFLLPSLFP